MPSWPTRLAAVVAAVLMVAAPGGASAQVFNPQRDCQSILKCNYARGGSFRGCISAYTCKSCRMVPARCTVQGETKCQRMKCGWGI